MKTIFYILAVCLSFNVVSEKVLGDSAVTAQLSPIPPYPANGVIPEALASQYLFRDLSTGNLVVSYPAELTPIGVTPEGVAEGGRMKQIITLNDQVDPLFDVNIIKAGIALTYSYTVQNTSNAKQAIAHWRIKSPKSTAAADQANIEPTGTKAVNGLQPSPTLWTAADPGNGPNWIANSPSSGIAVGGSIKGFAIQSNLRPGFVRAFASGSANNALTIANAPLVVQQQLEALRPFAINERLALTIGPKFSNETPDVAIVMDFASGIETLIKHQYLSASSPLVQELRDKLRAYLVMVGSVPTVAVEQYPPFALQLQNKPGSNLEQTITGALLASIGTR